MDVSRINVQSFDVVSWAFGLMNVLPQLYPKLTFADQHNLEQLWKMSR